MWLESALNSEIVLAQPLAHDLAFIVRLEAKGESYYFKAGDRTLEADVTAYLSRHHLAYVPRVVAFDTEKDWLLTAASGQHLATFADINFWETALATLATLHQQIDVAELQHLGCPFDDFETLLDRGESFLQNKNVLRHWGMSDLQMEHLHQVILPFQQAHRSVLALGLHPCGVHGDAHPMNVLVHEENLLWFDWREARVAHPFTDIGWFLTWTFLPKSRALELPRSLETAQRLWMTYLNCFGLNSDAANLNDAMLLALVSRSLSYHEKFFNWQSSIPEFRPNYVNYFLRLLLRAPISL